MNVTLLRKLVTNILYYIFRLSGILQPAVLIVYTIVNMVSQKVTGWNLSTYGYYLRMGILLVYLRAHTYKPGFK